MRYRGERLCCHWSHNPILTLVGYRGGRHRLCDESYTVYTHGDVLDDLQESTNLEGQSLQ